MNFLSSFNREFTRGNQQSGDKNTDREIKLGNQKTGFYRRRRNEYKMRIWKLKFELDDYDNLIPVKELSAEEH